MNVLGVGVTVLALAVLFASTELLRRRGAPSDATRGTAHVLGAAAAATFPLYLGLGDVLFIGGLFTAVLFVTRSRGVLQSIHAVERPTVGAIAFPIGGMATAVAVWSTPVALSYALLVLALADPAAAAIGRLARGPGWPVVGGRKTLAGSVAFFAVTLGLTVAFFGATGVSFLAVSLAATTAEAAFGRGLDDLAVPLTAGLLARALLL
jgi:phytol kinase